MAWVPSCKTGMDREAEKRRQQPDEDEGFVLVRDLANPTGADPPVPPPEYCVVSIAAD